MTAALSANLRKLCNIHDGTGTGFIDKIRKREIKFDPIREFERGIRLGQGSFGLVKRVQYPMEEDTVSIALKEVSAKDREEEQMIATELEALDALKSSEFVPKFYGCTLKDGQANRYAKNAPKIYIALELLDRGLDSTAFKEHIQRVPISDKLTLFGHMFKGLKDMNSQSLAHNDIKPANMMTNAEMTRVYLIDLGLASGTDDRILLGGTPVFMPPCKFTNSYKLPMYQPKDDMYSIAVSIADLISSKKNEVFAPPGQFRINNDCSRGGEFNLSVTCLRMIVENVKRILKNAGFGEYSANSSKKDINFTSLIADMVAYHSFSHSVQDVIDIIERLVRENQGRGKADEDRVVEEAKREEMRIKELEREKKRKEDQQRAKKEELERYIREQEEKKQKAKAKLEIVKKIDDEIMESRRVYREDKQRNKFEIERVKREAEDLIRAREERDAAHLRNDEFYREGALNFRKGVLEVKDLEEEVDPALLSDPILAHYQIPDLEKYNLKVLVTELKEVKRIYDEHYANTEKSKFDPNYKNIVKAAYEKDEKAAIAKALGYADKNAPKNMIGANKQQMRNWRRYI